MSPGRLRLNVLLAEQGMSQRELSARSGVARETINRLCCGKKSLPVRGSVVVALAYALGVEPAELADFCEVLPLGPRSVVTRTQYAHMGTRVQRAAS